MSKTQEEGNSTTEAECVEPLTQQKSLSCLGRFLLQLLARVTRVSLFKINALPKAQACKLLYYGELSMSSATYHSNTVKTIPDYQISQLKILALSCSLNS